MPITKNDMLVELFKPYYNITMQNSIYRKHNFKLGRDAGYDLWVEALTRTAEKMDGIKSKSSDKEVVPPVFHTMEDAANYVRTTASNMYINDISKKYHRDERDYKLYAEYVTSNASTDEEDLHLKVSYSDAWDLFFDYLRRDDYAHYSFKEVGLFKYYFDGGRIDGHGKRISYRSIAKEVGKSYNYVSRVINKILDDLRLTFAKQLRNIDFEE